MAGTTLCTDTSEAVELFKAQGLYLKPIAKLTVCVQLPKLKEMGTFLFHWTIKLHVNLMYHLQFCLFTLAASQINMILNKLNKLYIKQNFLPS